MGDFQFIFAAGVDDLDFFADLDDFWEYFNIIGDKRMSFTLPRFYLKI